jgi:hypothetical protein
VPDVTETPVIRVLWICCFKPLVHSTPVFA